MADQSIIRITKACPPPHCGVTPAGSPVDCLGLQYTSIVLTGCSGVERHPEKLRPLYAHALQTSGSPRSANLSLALAVACRDVDVRNVKALIIGPHETPYEFGFFEVCRVPYPGPIADPMLTGTVHVQIQQRSACSVAKCIGTHPSSNASPVADYPRKSPSVNAITTNGGRCRFNPNIYAQGRVCL